MAKAAQQEIDGATLVEQLRVLGVQPGGVLMVHASFRALRPVAGGPAGTIAALREALGPAGTLVMPSWTGDDDTPFAPASSPADPELGALCDCFWRLPDVRRGNHPMALAAVGPEARGIVEGPYPLPPHGPGSPVDRLYERDAQILLLGVNHDSDTMIHLAELKAGVRYRRRKHLTLLQDGVPRRIDYGENDHCCERFLLVDSWLRATGLQAEGPVGHAHARLCRARDVVAVARERLSAEPLLFLHPAGAGCDACDDARRSLLP